MIYKTTLAFLLIAQFALHAQPAVILENDFQVTGNIILGQDLSQDSVAGMMRWDSVSMTFQGFNGTEWISFISPSPSVGTDTLEVGDRYGGGIVFYTSGSHGLVITDFDVGLTSSILTKEISWGPSMPTTGANSDTDGASNTATIVSQILDTYKNGGYAAKVCEELVHEGFDDWYLPSELELQTMGQAIGLLASPPLTNLANLTAEFYWTSTEFSTNQARIFTPNDNGFLVGAKISPNYVRAIRAY